jgi:hypothetical protein
MFNNDVDTTGLAVFLELEGISRSSLLHRAVDHRRLLHAFPLALRNFGSAL